MEDAMILNKASHDRGFAHATVYKSEVLNIILNPHGYPSRMTIGRRLLFAANTIEYLQDSCVMANHFLIS